MNKKKLLVIILFFVCMLILLADIFILKKDIYIAIDANKPYYININNDFDIPSAKAYYCKNIFKTRCKDITNYLEVSNDIDNSIMGTYHVKYNINYENIKKGNDIEIIVTDLESPKIELKNYEKKYVCPNYKLDNFKDYTIVDNFDDESNLKITKYIKDNKLYYSVSDTHGNTSETNVDIEIKDADSPNISLKGNSDIYIMQGTEYKEPGFTAFDTCDGDISNKVVITNNIDTTKIGEYKVNYSVEDSAKNKKEVCRNIHVYNSTIGSDVPKNGNVVYLTFDDGPNAYTKNILEVLNRYQVKATFFVTNQFRNYKDLIKEAYDGGHAIAIHTYSHQYKQIYSSEDSYFADLDKMNNVIFEQTGIYTKLLRFPGGSSNTISRFNKGIMTRLAKQLKDKGYVYFDWNVDSNDTGTINSDEIANNVINGMKKNNTSVVLMHDIKYANSAALDKILYYGLTNGYTFLPLDENSPTTHHSINN